jgi:hypothetical protein
MQSCGSFHTCTAAKCFGLLGRSRRLRPIPMAPEETRITRCPSRRRRIHVSAMRERLERSGSWVFSSQIDEVPEGVGVSRTRHLLLFFSSSTAATTHRA